jgi:hypothetical protein
MRPSREKTVAGVAVTVVEVAAAAMVVEVVATAVEAVVMEEAVGDMA